MDFRLVKESFKGKEDVWNTDFKKPRIEQDLTLMFAAKHRGSVRLAMGLFYTNEEWETIRRKVLSTPLP